METTFIITVLLKECYLFHKNNCISNVKVFFIALALDLDGSCFSSVTLQLFAPARSGPTVLL